MSGGFLGVSTFFTLSGFLITTLLLEEHEASGTLSLRGFWTKRLRRLLPAATLTVAAVVASAPLWLDGTQRERLADDALATLFCVVNWRFAGGEYAYTLIFTDPSPFQHFWSLAIEGQFYLVFPLAVGLALRLGGGRRTLAVVAMVLLVGSVAIGVLAGPLQRAQDRLYYGTDARAAELLAGVLLACLARGGAVPLRGAAARLLAMAGTIAAIAILAAWSRAEVADAWLYRGGFAAYALASAIVIAAATAPRGPVRAVLSAGTLRGIGEVSYGAYLYHWPIFLVLSAERTGLSPATLLAVRVAITLALAALSHRFFELPIRRAEVLRGRSFGFAATGAVAAVAALALASSPISIELRGHLALHRAREILEVGTARSTEAPRFAIFGDSTAASLWKGLGPWLREEGGGQTVPGSAILGCGLMTFGEIENRGAWRKEWKMCRGMPEAWRESAERARPDVAIVLVGSWEARNRRTSPDAKTIALGDPEVDAAARSAIESAVDGLTATGATVVWLTSPRIRVPPRKGRLFDSDRAASDPARMDRLNEIVREIAQTRPEMRIVDLATFLRDWPGGELDESIRTEGVHFSTEGASEIARRWLGPEIVREYRQRSGSGG